MHTATAPVTPSQQSNMSGTVEPKKQRKLPSEFADFMPAPSTAEMWAWAVPAALVFFAVIVPMGWELRRFCIHDAACSRNLSLGWIPGLSLMDLSDGQYRNFRNSLHILFTMIAITTSVSNGLRSFKNINVQHAWYFVSSMSFIYAAHGIHMFFPVFFVVVNFYLTKWAGRYTQTATWTWSFGLLLLLGVNGSKWFRFGYFLGSWGEELDTQKSILDFSWASHFNLIMLRMVSFAMDRYWATADRSVCPIKVSSRDQPWGYGWRVKTHHEAAEYSLVAYMNYCFYLPLYAAGPTITFNAWLSYVKEANKEMDWRAVALYAARVFGIMFLFELCLHIIPTFALSYSKVYEQLSPLSTTVLGFWALHLLWLKFVILWRFFRLWALMDGVQPVENMQRCISNMLSAKQFWRQWHVSFNRWLVRYVYIPLGGSDAGVALQSFNTVCVFVFVALWHEVNLKLLAWGLTAGASFIPELLTFKFSKLPAVKAHWETWYYRLGKAVLLAACTYLNKMWNVLGFSVGLEGAADYFGKVLAPSGWPVLAAMMLWFTATAQVRFWLRKREVARADTAGIQLDPAF